MKKIIYFLSFVTLISTSCQHKKNRIVAEVYNKKLFESEVVDNIKNEEVLASVRTKVNQLMEGKALFNY